MSKRARGHFDGAPLRVVGTHTDITDRRRLEEITAHSRHQAASFIEHTPAPVAMLVLVFQRKIVEGLTAGAVKG